MKIPEIELTESNLKELREQFYPSGSGPLGVMAYVIGLIDAIAKEKGWILTEYKPNPPAIVRQWIPLTNEWVREILSIVGLAENYEEIPGAGKIAALKLIRQYTGCPLKEAKEYLEKIIQDKENG